MTSTDALTDERMECVCGRWPYRRNWENHLWRRDGQAHADKAAIEAGVRAALLDGLGGWTLVPTATLDAERARAARIEKAAREAKNALALTVTNVPEDGSRPHWCRYVGRHDATCSGMLATQDALRAALGEPSEPCKHLFATPGIGPTRCEKCGYEPEPSDD